MLWHMYIIDGGDIVKLSSDPYDAEALVAALEQLGADIDRALIVLMPSRTSWVRAVQCFSQAGSAESER